MAKKLPLKTFLRTFKLVPRIAINLLISDSKNQILLTKRAIPPFKSYWHLPGAFLLKDEAIHQAIDRIEKDELGIKTNGEFKLLGVFEDINKDPRGHVIDIIYGCKVENNFSLKPTGDNKELNFFKKLPSKIGFNHQDSLNKLGYKGEAIFGRKA